MVQTYLRQAIAPSTLRTYNSGKTRFSRFCQNHNYPVLPVSEDILCKYAAYIGNQGLKHGTIIKTYLSAIRHNYADYVGVWGSIWEADATPGVCNERYQVCGSKEREGKYKDETSHYSKVVKRHESWLNERSP